MPKNSLTDLHEIFVKSQRLTAHQTDAGSTARHLNRGVSELGEASRSLASRADTLALGGLAEDPHSRKIFNEVNSITLTTAQDSVSLEGTDLEGYLAHHHDMILLTAIEESRQINENYLYEIQQRSVLQEWENAKTQFMESLGHRAHKWTPAAALSMTNTSAANITFEGGDHQSLLEFNPNQTPFLARSVASSSATPAKRNPLTSTATDSSDRPVLPKIVASHADCVRKISTHQSQAISSRHENIHPCKLLLSSLKEVSAVNANTTQNILSTKDLIGYRSLLSLIASMTGEDRYGSDVIPGYFSTITADPSTVDLILLKEKKNRLTKGAKLFFEDQMMIAWDHKIEEAIQLHEIDLSSRHAGKTVQMKLQKLIQYEYRNHMIPKQCKLIDITINSVGGGSGVINTGPVPSILKNVPIWALVYYYLRSGNLDLAVQELQEAYLTYHYEDMFSVLCVLKAFIGETNDFRELRSPRATPGGAFSTPRHGSGGSGTPTALSANDAEVVESAIKQCKLHYQRESMKEESQIDPYYLFLLNLVALIDYRDLNGSLIPNFSFEDFLWAHLWFITTSRQLHDLLATSSSSSSATSANMIGTHSPFHRKPAAVAVETTSEENELLELVYAYGGATYFDHDGQSPFKYALLLCCCHRFGDALTYLWMSGKTFPAAHLLMICLYYGFVLPHVPLLHNPNHPLVNSDYHHYHHHHTTTASATVASLVSNVFHLTPGHIITMFVTNQLFQQYYPDYCLDYYLLLQTKWMESIHYNNEELLKLQIIKFDELIIEKLTQFLISLTPNQLKIILGIPTLDINNGDATDTSSATSLNGIVTKLLGREYRSKGYLDHYLKGEKIVVLCNKVIYYYLAVDKDLVRVIDYYQLLGGYNDILSLVGQELIRYWVLDTSTIVAASNTSTNTSDGEGNIYNVDVSDDMTATASSSSTSWSPVLLQKRRLRDFWRGRAEQLMKSLLSLSKHLEQQPQSSGRNANTNILHLLNLSNEMFNNFHLIMILYQLIDDVYRIQDYSKALLLLDMNQLFPSVQENVGGGMEGMSFFLNPVLKHIVDDLLIIIIHALYEFMKKYQAVALSVSHGRGGARSAWSLGAGSTDEINAIAKEYANMERRYQALSEFLVKYKDQLTKKQIILQEYQKLQSYMIVH